ncbi:hypothetical protein AZE42_05018 [Rhizopogon vesiculosus]|uniref:Uncharacterized protein n=1 Tax=Rhizopogon vesiculosus TaxID=180088 RepID=A0A1J8PZY0_9AGAM|nr:hypothetical protein AZE42_05018 [Rhizopogon vesiculosus]
MQHSEFPSLKVFGLKSMPDPCIHRHFLHGWVLRSRALAPERD